MSNKITPNEFMRGYMCAIANMIYIDGEQMETNVREAWAAGGCTTLAECRKHNVDESDIEKLKPHFKELARLKKIING